MKNYIKIAKNAYHNILLVPQLLERLQQLEAKLSTFDEKSTTMLTAAEKTAATVAELERRIHDTQDTAHTLQGMVDEQKNELCLSTFYNEQYFHVLYKQSGESDTDAKKRFFMSLPKATGGLRLLQQGNALLLKKFKDVCEANGLQYWLCSGTLIGALRHGGFVPWDDDLDVAMLRPDFEKLLKVLSGNKTVRITLLYDWWAKCRQIRFKFADADLPFFVDIFTYDAYAGILDKNIETESRIKMIDFLDSTDKEEVRYWREHPYLESDDRYFEKIDAIFPLKKLRFEGEYYSVPNDAHEFISSSYGDIYRFPKDIFTHFEHTPHTLMEDAAIKRKVEVLFEEQE